MATPHKAESMAALQRLWSLRRRRPLFVAVALATGLFLLSYPVVDALLRSRGIAPEFVFWDFGAYGGAVNRWQAGEPIYITNADGDFHGKYLYPPVVLLLFWPFTQLSYPLPAMLWGVVSVAVLWAGMQTLLRALGVDLRWHERLLLLWALLGFQPLLLTLKLGQMAGFLTGLLCLAYAALVAGDADTPAGESAGPWSFLSGGLTAVVGLVKLPYAPASAHLLASRDRLLGGVAAVVAVAGLSLAAFGLETNLAYHDVLRWGIEAGKDTRPPTLWLPPYYQPLYVVRSVSFELRVLLSGAIAVLAFTARGADADLFALGVAAVPLLAPQTYTYYLVALLPAAAVLLVGELNREGWPAVPVLALLLAATHSYGLKLLVDARFLFAYDGLRWLWEAVIPALQPALWGNLLLVGLATWRVWERSRFV